MTTFDRPTISDRSLNVDLGGPDRVALTAPRITIRQRRTAKPDLVRMAAAVRELLIGLGEDPDREGLLDTPMRVARSFAEQNAGLRDDPAKHLGRVFNSP